MPVFNSLASLNQASFPSRLFGCL